MKQSNRVNVAISDLYWDNLKKILDAIDVSVTDFAKSAPMPVAEGSRFSRIQYRMNMKALKGLISDSDEASSKDVAMNYWTEINDCYRNYYPREKFEL